MDDYAKLKFIDEPFGFPWRTHDIVKIKLSFLRLKQRIHNDSFSFPLPYCRIGLNCTDAFFQKERLSTPSQSKKSCVDMWKNNTSKVLEYHKKRNRHKHKSDLFGTIVFMYHAPAHFSPYIAGMIYKYFNAQCVFDPYAGWGDRCLAAMALDIDYLGVDCNLHLVEPYKQLLETFSHSSQIQVKSQFVENIDIENQIFDLVFTSPPFWNNKIMLEKYHQSETNYDIFLSTSLFPILAKCFEKGCPICLYINEKMYKSIERRFGPYSMTISFKSPTNNKKYSGRTNLIYCWNSK